MSFLLFLNRSLKYFSRSQQADYFKGWQTAIREKPDFVIGKSILRTSKSNG
jgi:hypothetical protein